jgi:hypothetical protein
VPYNQRNVLLYLVQMTVIFLSFTLALCEHVSAQQSSRWAPQQRIPQYEILTEEPPFLFADQEHRVHAFNSQSLDENEKRAILYRQWSVEGGWTEPIDVIGNPGNDVELLSLFVDNNFTVHLVMDINGDIYYAKAPLVNAGKAPAWSTPVLVGQQSQRPLSAKVVSDDQDGLLILYASRAEGNSLYATYSKDGGENWSTPEAFYSTYDEDNAIYYIDAYIDQNSMVHIVWSVMNQTGIGISGYYTRFDLAQEKLYGAIEIDEGGLQLGIRFTTVIEFMGDLIMTYYNGRTNGHYWRLSLDGGQTWSQPVRLTEQHLGTNGPVSYAVDSNNVLHLLFGQRIDDNNHGVWHLVWNGRTFTGLEAVVRGPQVRDAIGGYGFDPHSARGVVVNGNLLFVSWGTDGFAGKNGAWYSYGLLDSPELPVRNLSEVPLVRPTAIQIAIASPSRMPTPIPIPSIVTVASSVNASSERDKSPSMLILSSLTPSLLVIILAVIVPYLFANRR